MSQEPFDTSTNHLRSRNTHLRVDFVIREVCNDGTVDPDELRFIRFGDDISELKLRDFFMRTADALNLMFRPTGELVITITNAGYNKIQVIKVIREITGTGLKDSKDMAEARAGTAIMSFIDHDQAKHCVKKMEEAGASVELRAIRDSDSKTFPSLVKIINEVSR